ncbi:MAG: TlpA family protein disulfide reductase [Chlamydiae bacterium]|nr:TlpA family protein disulfide reductase [Chlamydiota bacterium]MBI3277578.1 TlpA family protein disulfide reductase [Chlamydiota bacterium]
MKKSMVFVLILLGILFPLNIFSEGRKAPDFTLTDLEGKTFKLSDLAGKIVVLDFWATWCPPCQDEIPHFVELKNQYGSKGLEIVGIALDRQGVRVVKPFVERFKVNYTILIGDYDQVINDYGGVVGIPTTFLINREGHIVKQFVGYIEKEEFEEEVKKLL